MAVCCSAVGDGIIGDAIDDVKELTVGEQLVAIVEYANDTLVLRVAGQAGVVDLGDFGVGEQIVAHALAACRAASALTAVAAA